MTTGKARGARRASSDADDGLVARLRDGDWLTDARLRVYPMLVLGFFILAFAALFVSSDGRIDALGRPLGTDFSQVWVAGGEVLAGQPAAPFDAKTHFARQQQIFGPETPLFGWHYPPYFLAVAVAVALLPYLPALLAWQALSLPLYLAAVFGALRGTGLPRRQVLVAALAFPAVAINIAHGHNGFLTAGLLAGGCLLLPTRPLIAGAAFALLAYKPHFGLVLPLALAAGGHWRAIAAAAATFAAMTLASVLAFGLGSWSAFIAGLPFTRLVLEEGAPGFEKIQSVFAAVRLLGGPIGLAYAAQALVGLVVVAALVATWRSRADMRLKSAALLVAALLVTPYGFDYDMAVLGPAIAFAVAHGLEKGFAPWEKTLLALVWIMPLLARLISGAVLAPFGVAVMAAFFVMLARPRPAAG
jgi:hypothetical protein